MTKSIKKAYLCWLFGGLFGLHHLYLKRDKQAFIWLTTFGGFLIGFLRDLYRIPEYLKEANEDKEYLDDLNKQQSQLKKPIFKLSRFISSILVGSVFGYATNFCFASSDSDDAYKVYLLMTRLISPMIVSFIVYLIGTEGPMKCNLKWPLLGAYLAFLLDIVKNSHSHFSCAFVATLFLNWNIKWDRKHFEKKKHKDF